MAKWGEGDPRWIVEERDDCKNVNNWHWTEKNASSWSKDKIKKLLEGHKILNDDYSCEITEVTKLEGEAVANNRKSKLIFFYEWEIEASWKGKCYGENSYIKGKIEIPNLSEENSAEELDVIVTTNSSDDESYKLKQFMNKKGIASVRKQLHQYIVDLKQEFSQGMILPTKNSPSSSEKSNASKNVIKEKMNQPVKSESKSIGVKIHCRTLSFTEDFKCESKEIYRALTEKEMVKVWSRGPVSMECERGGAFSLFDGNVTGFFDELVIDEKIVMRWRYKSWPAEHYSNITLTISQCDDCCRVSVNQVGVPDSDYDRTREGWQRYYWQAINQTFGYGARLY